MAPAMSEKPNAHGIAITQRPRIRLTQFCQDIQLPPFLVVCILPMKRKSVQTVCHHWAMRKGGEIDEYHLRFHYMIVRSSQATPNTIGFFPKFAILHDKSLQAAKNQMLSFSFAALFAEILHDNTSIQVLISECRCEQSEDLLGIQAVHAPGGDLGCSPGRYPSRREPRRHWCREILSESIPNQTRGTGSCPQMVRCGYLSLIGQPTCQCISSAP